MDVNLTINIRLNIISVAFDFKRGRTKNKRYSTPLGSLDYYITQAIICDSDGIELTSLLVRSEHPSIRHSGYSGCGKKVDEI